jgi:hypothetical protein
MHSLRFCLNAALSIVLKLLPRKPACSEKLATLTTPQRLYCRLKPTRGISPRCPQEKTINHLPRGWISPPSDAGISTISRRVHTVLSFLPRLRKGRCTYDLNQGPECRLLRFGGRSLRESPHKRRKAGLEPAKRTPCTGRTSRNWVRSTPARSLSNSKKTKRSKRNEPALGQQYHDARAV